jgi:hypothetical protein
VLRRALIALLLLAAPILPATALGAYPNAFGAVKGNPADRLVNEPIDPYRYDHATHCRRSPMPGALALQAWLEAHAGGSSWGINRCEKLGPKRYSLHAEGRALDWRLDAHDRGDRREAVRIISLLLAPDRIGNQHALDRRMGIQEIIWDCRAWWSGSQAMNLYSACFDEDGKRVDVDDTNAHRDHIHFGLTRPGARKATSFWAR